MSAPLPRTGSRYHSWLMAALLVVGVLLCYARSLQGGFVWNDSEYVTRPDLRPVAGLGRIWTELGATEQYYPLLHTALWLQYRAWGDAPLGYHLVNVLLHAGSAVLFGLVLRRLAVPGAWLAAGLFALHPVHVESVAWITEQKNTLSLIFYLGAGLAYLRFDEDRAPRAYAAALALFTLSLLCKTMTATLPAALLVVFWWKRGRLDWRHDMRPLVPWLALGGAAGLFSSWVERHYVGAEGTDFALSGAERLLVAGRAPWFYLRQLLWPVDLNFIYARWTVDTGAWWQWLFVAGGLAAGAMLWALRRHGRAPLAGFLLFAGSLFPVLGFVNLYGARFSFVWDHWQYLPDLGPIALAAGGLVLLWERWAPQWPRCGQTLALTGLAGLGLAVHLHSGIFRDNEALYRATLLRNPSCWLAENNLGFLLANQEGRLSEALDHYQRALRLRPDYAEAELNLANALVSQPGRLPEAIAHYEHAVKTRPDYAEAAYNLANVLAIQPGRRAEALAYYQQALRAKPRFAAADVNLANALLEIPGREAEALSHYEQAIVIDPAFGEAHYDLANLLAGMPGRVPDAVAHFEQAAQLMPGSAEVHYRLGNLLLRLPGRMAEAQAQYLEALRIDPRFVAALNNLATVYARQGRRDEARKSWEKALELDPAFEEARRNLALLRALP